MNNHLRRSIQQILLAGSAAAFAAATLAGVQVPPPGPGQTPDYFGITPNYANSPQPVLATVTIAPPPAGVGSRTATAAASTYDYTNWTYTGTITDIQVVDGGAGYDPAATPPVVTINGGNSDATATATVSATGVITAITVNNAGTGYTVPMAGTGLQKFVDLLPGVTLGGTVVSSYATTANGYTATGDNGLGQQLPVAVANTPAPFGATADYYEIAEVAYTKRLHHDLPVTHLRGYVQIQPGGFQVAAYNALPDDAAKLAYASQYANYLGPVILATKGKAVRIKLVNLLPTGGVAGKLPFPVDTTYMGSTRTNEDTQNRTALHLHGGNTPWISDGTPRQTVKPVGEVGNNKGESARDVPDMWFDGTNPPSAGPRDLIASCAGQLTCAVPNASNNPGDGALTFYYTNQQSARLMFYHDHAEGITRLNVYDGMAAGYVLQDPAEQAMVYDATTNPAGLLPPLADTIPLIIQEKTFLPNDTQPVLNFYGAFKSQLGSQDPTWDKTKWFSAGETDGTNGTGGLWVPHVFMPNQNPGDLSGGNAMGRWDYGPWFWPPFTGIQHGPLPNPYADASCIVSALTGTCEGQFMPGVPNGTVTANDPTASPSGTPEAFNDTPLVNGTAYPKLTVDPKKYRLRLLSVGNDRMLNLSLVVAASKNTDTTANANAGPIGVATLCDGNTAAVQAECTEVKMVPFNATQNLPANTPFPSHWYTSQKGGVTFDGRPSGVPDPATRGPAMVQIGTEGGFLSTPVVIRNQPVNFEYNPKNIVIGNIKEHALLLGPAERADVVVDFSQFAGSTLIMYNDAPAPVPAFDLRLDYFTGNFDNTDTGGAFSTIPGYGPNTRTIMQIQVAATCTTANCGSAGAPLNRAPALMPTNPALRLVDDYDTAHYTALTAAVQTAFKTSQEPIIVPQVAYNTVYGTTVSDALGANVSTITGNVLSYKPLVPGTLTIDPAALPVTLELQPKTIIEDWTANWGRMNALLGVEVPRTTSIIATSIPQAYIDPPTELVKITPNDNTTPITGTLADGTQLWKVTHNGVDSHAIHFHLFHVQIVNRVGWDGAVRMPAANELGWKDTVLMHPLEDIVVALRPKTMTLPFKVANSHRIMDPSLAADANPAEFFNLDPLTANASNVNNGLTANFGWEYVWHCHILGHEENDMMRAIAVAQTPETPVAISATGPGTTVTVNWTDKSIVSNWTQIQRSTESTFATPALITTFNVVEPECALQAGCPMSYVDTTVPANTSVYYRVMANNTVGAGDGRIDVPRNPDGTYGATLPIELASLVPGFTGYANVTANSAWSNTVPRLIAPIATLTPNPLTITGTTNVGSNSGTQFVTLQNTGNATLTVTKTVIVTAPFARNGGTCTTGGAGTTFTLAPNASCTIGLRFTPTAACAALGTNGCTGTLTVTDNSTLQTTAQTSTQVVALRGTGVALPAVPTALTVISPVTNSGLTLRWNAVTGATSYTVQRATNSTFTQNVVTTNNVATASLAVSGLTGNTTYYFQVRAVNAVGNSAYSTFVNQLTLPSAPTGVTAANGTAGGTITAGLNWTAPTGGAASYNVRWATNAAMTTGTGSSTNVASGQQINVGGAARTLFMQVMAINASGTSAWTPATPVSVNAR